LDKQNPFEQAKSFEEAKSFEQAKSSKQNISLLLVVKHALSYFKPTFFLEQNDILSKNRSFLGS
jgi:hypothetical protein